MKVCFSNRYKQHARIIIDEVIRLFGSATRYKEVTWGRELSAKEVLSICDDYVRKNQIDVNVYFGKSLVTTMSNNGLSLVSKPNYYRELRLISLLDHEIGTHHLRAENQRNLDKEYKSAI